MNKENLLRMADHIENIPQKDFDMFEYRGGDYDEIECDTVGCAVGHCAILDTENIRNNFVYSDGDIDFEAWSNEFTDVYDEYQWDYLFSAAWASVDNTPKGTANRIRGVVEHGFPEKMKITKTKL